MSRPGGTTQLTPQTVFIVFAVLTTAVLALAITPNLNDLLPTAIARQLSRNSEALVFILLVVVDLRIKSVGPERLQRFFWWPLLLVGYLATAFGSTLSIPAEITTSSEALLAALVLSLYLHWSRDPEDRLTVPAWVFPMAVALIAFSGELPVAGWEGSAAAEWIVTNAEAWGFLILGAVLFDAIHPFAWGSRPAARGWAQVLWPVVMVTIPVAVAVVNPHGVDSSAAVGPYESALVWIQRITEAFIAGLALWLYAVIRTRLACLISD